MTIYCQRCGRNLAADERKSALGYTLCPACIRDFNDAPDMPTWGHYRRWVEDGRPGAGGDDSLALCGGPGRSGRT